MSPPELVEAAQKALGFAKAMGGNQVQLSRDLPSRESRGQRGLAAPLGAGSHRAQPGRRRGRPRRLHPRALPSGLRALRRHRPPHRPALERGGPHQRGRSAARRGQDRRPGRHPDQGRRSLSRGMGMHPRASRTGQADPRAGARAHRRHAAGAPPSGALRRHRLPGAVCGARTSLWAPGSSPPPTPTTPSAPTGPTGRAARIGRPRANSAAAAAGSSIPGW